jgi:hypothetical protein
MGRFRVSLIILIIVLICQCIEALNLTVKCWNAIEISLNAKSNYSHPYIDVDDLSATFLSESGISMTMISFWDGGQTWKIRFAPTCVGIWTYKTNASGIGLNNQMGFITCTRDGRVKPFFESSLGVAL